MSIKQPVALVRVSYVKQIVYRVAKREPRAFEWCSECNFPENFFDSTNEFMPSTVFNQWLAKLAQHIDADQLLELYKTVITEAYVPNVLLCLPEVPTVKQALEAFSTTVHKDSPHATIKLVPETNHSMLLAREFPKGYEFESVWSEMFSLLCIWEVFNAIIGINFRPKTLFFYSANLSSIRTSSFLSGIELRSGFTRNGFQIPSKLLDATVNIGGSTDHTPNQTSQQFSSNFVWAIYQLTALYLGDKDLSVDYISKLVEIPVRTLQRRLKYQDTSFRKLKELATVEKATEELAKGKSVSEVAFNLGYTSVAPFSRMFKRNTGFSPSQTMKATRANN